MSIVKNNGLSSEKILTLSKKLSFVAVTEITESTNDDAKRAAGEGTCSGSVFVANTQTKGRGRRNREFFSPKDSGVYFSVVLRPSITAEQSVLVTTAAALAAAEAIERLTGKTVEIKWINDVYLNGKKCVGILTEAVFGASEVPDAVIVGVGINVTTVSFPEEIANRACSIGEVDRNELIALVADKLIERCESLPCADFLREYKERCFVLGKTVTVNDFSGVNYTAKAIDIDEKGRLIVEKCGKFAMLSTEEVSVTVEGK